MAYNNLVVEKDEITDLLKEMDLNVDVDVAFLAAQTPPIKIFPTPNTTHLPYDKQVAALEADYTKYYEYRGDLTYNEKMKRPIVRKEPHKSGETTCLYRVCRDKHRFYETRVKDDVVILSKILESMIERTSEMEKHLERVLMDNGEKERPNWDELYEEMSQNVGGAAAATPEKNDNDPKDSNDATQRKPKRDKITAIKHNFIAAPNQLNDQNHPSLTHEQAQMFVAQLMFARSLSNANRIYSNPDHSDAANGMDSNYDYPPPMN